MAACSIVQIVGAQAPPKLLQGAALVRQIDSLFDPWRGTDRPGCAVALGTASETLLERGYGMADLESGVPMTPDRVVHAASLSKQVTALAVLLLARDGRLSLDDDVRRYIPEIPSYERPITIRHLLTHTSGLRDFFEGLILARGRFEESRITSADALSFIAQQDRLNFPPGSDFLYSNSGYVLAAEIIARVSGLPYDQFVRTRIFEPLGMTHTRIRRDVTAIIPNRAVGYARTPTGFRTSVPNFDVVGSTNMETTVGDLLRLGRNLMHPVVGDSLLVHEMLTRTVLPSGDTTQVGLGLMRIRDRSDDLAEHEGGDPGFRAYFGWFRGSGLLVGMLCNTSNLDPVGLGRRVVYVALGEQVAFPPPPPSPVAPIDLRAARGALRWAGVYREPQTRALVELTVRDSVLYSDRVGGVRLDSIGPHKAHLAGTPLDLVFDSASAVPHPDYVVWSSRPGRRKDRFVWIAPSTWQPTAKALSAYGGVYRNASLNAEYVVTTGDSTVTVTPRGGTAMTMRPVVRDGFVSGQLILEFQRAGDRVAGLAITHPRTRGLTFVRQTERSAR